MRESFRLLLVCGAIVCTFSACSAPGSLPRPSMGSAFATRTEDLTIRHASPLTIETQAPAPDASKSPGDGRNSGPIVAHLSPANPVIAPVSIAAPARAEISFPGVRTHTLSAMYGQDSAATINTTFGMNNWAAAAQYVDMMFYPGSLTYNNAVRAGGIKTVIYIDPNLCSGSYAVAPNRFAGPDCAQVASDAFYSEPGYSDLSLTVSSNNAIQQKFGNPASTTLQNAALAGVQHVIATQGQADYVFIDDAATPPEYGAWGRPLCWGTGTFGSTYSCANAPGGTASGSYGQYSKTQWQTGEAALAARMPLPVMFNGLGADDYNEPVASIAPVAVSASNVAGAMCENCFYGMQYQLSNLYLHTGAILDLELTGIMNVVNAGRMAMIGNDTVTDTNQRALALADIMLVYDPDRVWMNESTCGSVSHIHACAEQGLTFYEPVGGYPSSPHSLLTSTGAYAREFGACFNRGELIGPCATVVNPSRTNSVALPVLGHLYSHTLTISGTGPCACYGDSGSVSTTGPRAPAVLPAATAYVLFL